MSTAKLSGADMKPAWLTMRPAPKNLPRAWVGAMSEPSTCIDPESKLLTTWTQTKPTTKAVKDSGAVATIARKTMPAPISAWPGTMVTIRPKRSIR